MNLEDWHNHMESVLLTDNQLGRILAEYERLGLCDRAERLAVTAALIHCGELTSTRQLTQGQAGRVVRALMECQDRADLPMVNLPSVSAEGNMPQPATPALRASQAWESVILTLAKTLVPGAWQSPSV